MFVWYTVHLCFSVFYCRWLAERSVENKCQWCNGARHWLLSIIGVKVFFGVVFCERSFWRLTEANRRTHLTKNMPHWHNSNARHTDHFASISILARNEFPICHFHWTSWWSVTSVFSSRLIANTWEQCQSSLTLSAALFDMCHCDLNCDCHLWLIECTNGGGEQSWSSNRFVSKKLSINEQYLIKWSSTRCCLNVLPFYMLLITFFDWLVVVKVAYKLQYKILFNFDGRPKNGWINPLCNFCRKFPCTFRLTVFILVALSGFCRLST